MPLVTPARRGAAVLAGVVVLLLLVVGGVLLLGGDEPAVETTAPEEPEPQEEQEEEQPPPPVSGEAELVEIVDLSPAGQRLFGASMEQDQPVPPDEEAVDALFTDVVDWLDEHLTRLQEGEVGLAADASLDGSTAALALTDPEHPVAEARYAVVVGAIGAPEWARAAVDVEHENGEVLRAQLVFVPGEDGPRLVAAQGDGQAIASGDEMTDQGEGPPDGEAGGDAAEDGGQEDE